MQLWVCADGIHAPPAPLEVAAGAGKILLHALVLELEPGAFARKPPAGNNKADQKPSPSSASRRGVKTRELPRPRRTGRAPPWWRGRNRSIGRVRGFIEGTNACLKRWPGCGRAICLGLERVMMQMTLGVLAFNLTRATAMQEDGRV
jgi:hypothetical protein